MLLTILFRLLIIFTKIGLVFPTPVFGTTLCLKHTANCLINSIACTGVGANVACGSIT